MPPGTAKFVAVTGSDSNSGDTEADAYQTLKKGIDSVGPGQVLFVKAGDYGNQPMVTVRSGTASARIRIEGYHLTPGDRPKHDPPIDVTNKAFSSALMPLINSGNRTDPNTTVGIRVQHDYIDVKSFQIEQFTIGVNVSSGAEHGSLQYIYTKDNGDYTEPNWYRGGGISINGDFWQLDECVVLNTTGQGITANSNDSVYNDCAVYCDEGLETAGDNHKGTDYYYVIVGDRNTFNRCHEERADYMDYGHLGHGFRTRGQYNVFNECVGINMGTGAFSLQNYDGKTARYNQFLNCRAYSRATTGPSIIGVTIRSGASDNLIDNLTVERLPGGLYMYGIMMSDLQATGVSSEGNTFRNMHFKDVSIAISARNPTSSVARNNVFENNVIDNSGVLFQADHPLSANNEFRNNTVTSVPTMVQGPAANMQMSTAAGSFSETGNTDTNTLVGCGFVLP